MAEHAIAEFLWTWRFVLIGALVALAALEAAWVRLRADRAQSWRESGSNVLILFVTQALRGQSLLWRYGVFVTVAELSPARIGSTARAALGCYVAIDFVYYWKHRWLHHSKFGWSIHSVHHSSHELNLTTSVRSSWIQRVVDDLFFLPVVAVGFDPFLVLLLIDVNLESQFWIHTRVLPQLGPLEGVLNTPSSHRVHHAMARTLSNSNYGSTFIVWDRLFGTYVREPVLDAAGGALVYGTPDGRVGSNPIRIQIVGITAYVRALLHRHRNTTSASRPSDEF